MGLFSLSFLFDLADYLVAIKAPNNTVLAQNSKPSILWVFVFFIFKEGSEVVSLSVEVDWAIDFLHILDFGVKVVIHPVKFISFDELDALEFEFLGVDGMRRVCRSKSGSEVAILQHYILTFSIITIM